MSLAEQIARAQLWHTNGYRAIPCLRYNAPKVIIRNGKEVNNSPGKRPHPDLWRDKEKAVYSATAATIADWQHARNIKLYTNTGIACGKAVAADCDIYDPELASATEALVFEHLGTTPLRRVGREPKALLLYRAATEPLNKAATALFVNDAGQTAQLEIMGQGQQIVAHGMHPCGTPYTWGEQSPDDTPLSALPAVTQGQVAELIADAEALFLEHGYRPKGIEPPREAAAPSPSPKPHRTADHAGPFRAVNDAAMADLGRWVPHLFGDDARDDRHGGYRVSSDALGRDLEEDISISPAGIVDFGVHDIGDANLGKRTPIDLVMEYGNAADAVAAAKWLAELTGTPFELPHQVDSHWEQGDPHATGRARARPNGHDGGAQPKSSKGKAEPRKPMAEPPPRPALVWADDIVLDLDYPGVVDGHIPHTGIGVSYGESGSGKTFVVLDRACHVAAGLPWRGMDVEQGVVIYIAAESPESVKRRVWAWKRHHRVEHLPLLIVQASVDLLNGSTTELVKLVTKVTTEHGHVAMIVVDTLARAMVGNENAPEDMGAFVSACGALREAGNTFVLIVHHCGKNAALGARGHSSLRAATDFEEEISLTEDGEGSIRTTKSRDDCSGRVLGFRLDTFELGENRKGRTVTTCVVRPADPPAKAPPKAPIGALQRVLVDELRKLARRHPEGTEEAMLKSAFIATLHAQRQREGKPALEGKRYTNKFNETLASAIASGHVDRLEDDLLRPGS